MISYYDIKGFEFVYLEDSYVLDIFENKEERSITFSMDLILVKNHPLFTFIKQGEHYCYKKANIVFTEVESVSWIEKNIQPIVDVDGTIDFGNIDTFIVLTTGYQLCGEWGEVIINSKAVPTISYQHD